MSTNAPLPIVIDADLGTYADSFCIGAVGLASPVEGFRREAVEQTIRLLREKGFSVKVGETVFANAGYKTASAKERIGDLESMFRDPDVNLIMNLTGGYNSNDLLEDLDYDMIQKNPKWFAGYSDITALNLALYTKARLNTVNGPMLVDSAFDPQSLQRLFSSLQKGATEFSQPETQWSSCFAEKEKTEAKLGPIQRLPNKKESAEGKIIAGNLSTFNLLLGTPYMPREKDTVFFLEYDKEEAKGLPAIERMLRQLRVAGMFDTASALVFGAVEEVVQKEEDANDNLLRILSDVTEGYDFPVLCNAGFGHKYPSWPLINGQKIGIQGTSITVLEPVSLPRQNA